MKGIYIMFGLKKKILAVLIASAMTFAFTACNDNKNDYEYLKTEIVGIWCDQDGPIPMTSYDESTGEEIDYYLLYEFTEDGRMIYHKPSVRGSIYSDSTYSIEENYMTLGTDGRCIISIEGDTLTLTAGNGDTIYKRMTVEEFSKYGVYAIGSELWAEQSHYLGFDGQETTLAIGEIFNEE